MKTCIGCSETKATTEFHKNSSFKDGVRTRCKSCVSVMMKSKRLARGELKDFDRRNNLRRAHGITPEEYDEVLERQGGVCAVCYSPERSARNVRLCVDHDHVTGELRGLLCSHCNRALGLAGDSPERLRRMAEYIELPSLVRTV